ncbi:hypothetical protein CJ177_08285 [Rhodococcus sp. ACPA1]|nr:hypothetical protein CJ177_08285 [Rhodococcus sp. ACPA1]
MPPVTSVDGVGIGVEVAALLSGAMVAVLAYDVGFVAGEAAASGGAAAMWSMASCLTEYVLLQQGTRSDPIQLSGASYRSAWRPIPSLFALAAAYLAPWSSLQGCLGGAARRRAEAAWGFSVPVRR